MYKIIATSALIVGVFVVLGNKCYFEPPLNRVPGPVLTWINIVVKNNAGTVAEVTMGGTPIYINPKEEICWPHVKAGVVGTARINNREFNTDSLSRGIYRWILTDSSATLQTTAHFCP